MHVLVHIGNTALYILIVKHSFLTDRPRSGRVCMYACLSDDNFESLDVGSL